MWILIGALQRVLEVEVLQIGRTWVAKPRTGALQSCLTVLFLVVRSDGAPPPSGPCSGPCCDQWLFRMRTLVHRSVSGYAYGMITLSILAFGVSESPGLPSLPCSLCWGQAQVWPLCEIKVIVGKGDISIIHQWRSWVCWRIQLRSSATTDKLHCSSFGDVNMTGISLCVKLSPCSNIF